MQCVVTWSMCSYLELERGETSGNAQEAILLQTKSTFAGFKANPSLSSYVDLFCVLP